MTRSAGSPRCRVPDRRGRGPKRCAALFERATGRRAGFPGAPAVRGAAAGRARRRAGRSGRARVEGSGRGGPPRRDAGRRAGAGRPRGARRRRRGAAALVLQPFPPIQPMLADSAAGVDDALRDLGEASLEYKLDGARIQVTRRATRCASTRGTCATSRRRPRSRRGRAVVAGARHHSRRRGDRAAQRRHAASVSDHDAAVRPQARRRRLRQTLPVHAVLLRLPVPRRRSADRRAARPPRRRPGAPGAGQPARSAHRDRRRRRGGGVPRARARRRPRRRDGEGARRPLCGGPARARRG